MGGERKENGPSKQVIIVFVKTQIACLQKIVESSNLWGQHYVRVIPSLLVTSNERGWFCSKALTCQFWSQFLLMGSQPVLEPLTLTVTMSSLPATLLISTEMKILEPVIVNRIPSSLVHFILLQTQMHQYIKTNRNKKYKEFKRQVV